MIANHQPNQKAAMRYLPSLVAFFCLLFLQKSDAESYISIIIDDIGYDVSAGKKALQLSNHLTYAVLPDTPYANHLIKYGEQLGREMILHLPMQSIDQALFTPDVLHMHMTEFEFTTQLSKYLARYPTIKGINNHMGSLLTQHPAFMQLLMQRLSTYKSLYFIDSLTTLNSVAYTFAKNHNIPSYKRDIFLDNIKNKHFISTQFDKLLQLAKQRGYAMAIAHPYKQTITVLQQRLNELNIKQIQLLTASTFIKRYSEQRDEKSINTLSAGL